MIFEWKLMEFSHKLSTKLFRMIHSRDKKVFIYSHKKHSRDYVILSMNVRKEDEEEAGEPLNCFSNFHEVNL